MTVGSFAASPISLELSICKLSVKIKYTNLTKCEIMVLQLSL